MTDQKPTPTADLDVGLAAVVRRGKRALPITVATLLVLVCILGGATAYLLIHATGERRRIDLTIQRDTVSQCLFFADIATVPLVPQTTEFGTRIVVDSRNIYVDLACNPALPPPPQLLRDLAAKYHLTLKG